MTDDERAVWEQLLAERPIPDVKASPLGLAVWQRQYPDRSWRCVVARDAGRPVAIAPLAESRLPWRDLLARRYGAVGDLHWRCGYPITGHDVAAGIRALLDTVGASSGWDVLGFGPMLAESAAFTALVTVGTELGMRPLVTAAGEAPRVVIDGTFDAFYRSLGGNLRSQVSRGERRLAGVGELVLEEHRGGKTLSEALAAFYVVEASGWKGREGSAIARDPRLRALYNDLAREAARCGRLRLYLLRAAGAVIAGDFCIEHDSSVFMLKTGYDEKFAKFSPGQVLRRQLLARLWANGETTSYDFMPGGGDHAGYKQRWSNDVRTYAEVRLFHPRTMRGRTLAGLAQLKRRFADAKRRLAPA